MIKKRKKYYEEISPTYHIDPRFEMNASDLFPSDEVDNRILRVLGMAIVPGIDIIRDKKLTKGHKFSCKLPEITAQNFGEPVKWKLFRKMYDDFKAHSKESLLDIVEATLTEKVQSMPQDALRECIKQYIEKVSTKLDTRNFSRLISARLTYREISELKRFLEKDGYAMNIERYIKGD